MKKTISAIFILSLISVLSFGQSKDWGRVSASLESTHHMYVDDAVNNFLPTSQFDPNVRYLDGSRYASNNFFKVDYYNGRFSSGLQMEGFFPTTVGYPYAQNRLTLSNLYVAWTDKSYSVTVGSFYDQLGSGLLFRSWEDRALGLNNAVFGARFNYRLNDIVSAKLFAGVPRLDKLATYDWDAKFFGLGFTDVYLAAADLSFSISELIGWDALSLSLDGSLLYKHESLESFQIGFGCKEDNVGWSARLNMETNGFYMKGEYVDAGMQYYDVGADRGNAQLLEFGYNAKGLGISMTGRRIDRMTQKLYSAPSDYHADANVLSYCPAMTTQYTYMLTTLVPYSANKGIYGLSSGEIGGQLDAFYNFRRGTKLGGKRGMKVHANFSSYFALNETGGVKGGERLITDFSFDIEKQWTKKFKTTLLYSYQDYNKHEKNYANYEVYIGKSHIVVADLLYKWNPMFSTRLELQYLSSNDYQGDWMAALLEVSMAPHWSVFASDMYNHGDSKLHYYNAGLSYVYGQVRVAAGYGRYRAGFICSGGVCREIPAYTGANLTITASF